LIIVDRVVLGDAYEDHPYRDSDIKQNQAWVTQLKGKPGAFLRLAPYNDTITRHPSGPFEIIHHDDAMNHVIEVSKVPPDDADPLQYFHHVHHDLVPSEVEHCGGPHAVKFPRLDYTIEHCSCGKHAIDNGLALGHDLTLRETAWRFVEPCPVLAGKFHMESGSIVFYTKPWRCSVCNAWTDLSCSKCQKVWYCSTEHQNQHWNEKHEQDCPSQ
jgi:hypothetical protein